LPFVGAMPIGGGATPIPLEASRCAEGFRSLEDVKEAAEAGSKECEWHDVLASTMKAEEVTYLSLATVAPNGFPAVRTVVFRGFEGNSIVIGTDRRTLKVTHIKQAKKPVVQILWNFPALRRQFRVTGWVECIDQKSNEAQLELLQRWWKTIPTPIQKWSAGPTPSAAKEISPSSQTASTVDPFTNFALMIVHPLSVDYIGVTSATHILYEMHHGKPGWKATLLNP